MKMGFENQRQSNIELLRIILMIGVIILHYCNPNMGGMAYAKGINLYILYLIESLFVCAVNLFVLITGYFLCITDTRLPLKPLELILYVALYFISPYLNLLIKKRWRIRL